MFAAEAPNDGMLKRVPAIGAQGCFCFVWGAFAKGARWHLMVRMPSAIFVVGSVRWCFKQRLAHKKKAFGIKCSSNTRRGNIKCTAQGDPCLFDDAFYL